MCVTRTVRARKVRDALGNELPETKGALGISKETRAESGKERRTAINAPPAEMLRAVANSNNSRPSSSRLRTKIGIASGKRGHFRFSISGLCRFNRRLPRNGLNLSFTASWGPNRVQSWDNYTGSNRLAPIPYQK